MHSGLKWYEIKAFIYFTDKNLFPMSSGVGCEWVSEWAPRSAAERASKVSGLQQANEWMAQYSMHRFHSHSTQCAVAAANWRRRWRLISGGDAQWVETVWNRRVHFIDKNLFPVNLGASEWASEQCGVANEWVMQANERADEWMALYSTRRFHSHSTQCAGAAVD